MKIAAILTAAAALAVLPAAPAAAQFNTNLIVNGNAEGSAGGSGGADGPVSGFTVTSGGLAVIRYDTGGGYPGATDLGVTAASGANFFGGGFDAVTTAVQRINVSFGAAAIDAGTATFILSALLGGYAGQDDNATLSALFFGDAGALGLAGIGPVLAADRNGATGFLARSATGAVPVGTRFIDVTLGLTRTNGSANDGYADNLSLVLGAGQAAAVPEPAGWAMMILGFGATGAALRVRPRRRTLRPA